MNLAISIDHKEPWLRGLDFWQTGPLTSRDLWNSLQPLLAVAKRTHLGAWKASSEQHLGPTRDVTEYRMHIWIYMVDAVLKCWYIERHGIFLCISINKELYQLRQTPFLKPAKATEHQPSVLLSRKHLGEAKSSPMETDNLKSKDWSPLTWKHCCGSASW